MVAEAKGRVQNHSPEQVAAELDGGDVTLVEKVNPALHREGYGYYLAGRAVSEEHA